VPPDFYLFEPFKYFFLGKRFEDQNAFQRKTLVQYLTSLGKKHYIEGMFKLVK
jgi:hypothetical protein